MAESAHTRALGEGSVGLLVLKYSLPAMLSTVVDALYNFTDRIFVGRACGENALAAVTVCFSPTLFFLAIGMTIGVGSATLCSIKLGRHDVSGATKVLGQAFFLFVVFCAAVAVFTAFFVDELLLFFGATVEILPMASGYYEIILYGMIFSKISYGINNMIRAEGRPFYSMGVNLVGAVLNIFLDWLFLFEFGWGIEGAAWATVASQAVAASLVLLFYASPLTGINLKLSQIRPYAGMLKKVLKLGSPAFVIQFLSSFAVMLFVMRASEFGSVGAVAVIGVSTAVSMFVFLPVVGMGAGVQPIYGYNWGAKNMRRVRSAFFKVMLAATLLCCFGFASVQIFAEEIFALFLGADSPLLSMGARSMRIMTAMFPFVGLNIVVSGYFQATGRPKFSIFITTIRQLIVLMPMFVLLPHWFGLDGVWLSYPVSDFISFLFTLYFAYSEMGRLAKHIS